MQQLLSEFPSHPALSLTISIRPIRSEISWSSRSYSYLPSLEDPFQPFRSLCWPLSSCRRWRWLGRSMGCRYQRSHQNFWRSCQTHWRCQVMTIPLSTPCCSEYSWTLHSWSRNNRYLLSASLDATVIIWDLASLSHPMLQPSIPIDSTSSSSSRKYTIRFDAPVSTAHFHPRNSKIILASLTCNEVVLVDIRKGGGRYVLQDLSPDEGMEVDGDETVEEKKRWVPGGSCYQESRAKRQESIDRVVRATLTCAVFSPCGSRIYAGTIQGELLIIDPPTRFVGQENAGTDMCWWVREQVTQRYKVANAAIRHIAFDPQGRYTHTPFSVASR